MALKKWLVEILILMCSPMILAGLGLFVLVMYAGYSGTV